MQGNLHPLANPSLWTSSNTQEKDRGNEEAGACLPQVYALGRKTETTTGRPQWNRKLKPPRREANSVVSKVHIKTHCSYGNERKD